MVFRLLAAVDMLFACGQRVWGECMRSNGIFRKALSCLLVLAVLCLTTPSPAKADTPLILVVIEVAAAVVSAAAAVYSASQTESKKEVNVKVDPPIEAAEKQKGDVNVKVNGNIAPTKTVVLPQDVPDLARVYPYADIAETTTFSIENDELSITTDARNFASVAPNSARPVVAIPHVDFDIERIGETIWTRPPGAVGDGTFQLSVNLQSLTLSTRDIARTHGIAGWELTVVSPELGTIFTTTATVEQGGSVAATGAIPANEYVSAPGSGQATLSKIINLSVPVPAALATVSAEIHLRTFGIGDVTGGVPASPLVGYALVFVLLFGAGVVVLWRRHSANGHAANP
jgi:hypothetical protein